MTRTPKTSPAVARPAAALSAFALAAALAATTPAAANDVGAAIAAGAVGLAVGAALAKNHHSHHDKHPNRFSPAPGIECYDHQRACYHDGGGFSSNWTWRVYG